MIETFHLTPLSPLSTGLPERVWISTYAPGVSEGAIQNFNRPEIYYGEDFAKVHFAPAIEIVEGSIADADFDRLRRWIELNLEVLLSHWRGDIDSIELAHKIIPIP